MRNIGQTWAKSNKPFAFSGTASSHDPTGSLSFSLIAFKSGLYNQVLPSCFTRFLHGKRLGIGKQSVTKSTWTFRLALEEVTASFAAESCKWSLATSLDQPATLVQGSFTAITSKNTPFLTLGTGNDGQNGISESSSSYIRSGYRAGQVMLSLACPSLILPPSWNTWPDFV